MSEKVALVTGGTGFIGKHLVAELRRRGWKIVAAGIEPIVDDDSHDIENVYLDFQKPDSMAVEESVLARCDVVFHLAALVPVSGSTDSDYDFIRTNFLGTVRLLDASDRAGVRRFIYASTSTVIGEPVVTPITEEHPLKPDAPYYLSKLCAELYCEMIRKTKAIDTVSLRITAPYGPGMNENTVLPLFIHKALHSENLLLHGHGKRRQNFVHVEDIVRAFLLGVASSEVGVFNLAGASSISMRELAEMILRLTPGSQSKIGYSGQADLQEDLRRDMSLEKSLLGLGYEPSIMMEDGVRGYVEYLTQRNISVDREHE
jgi:UDP-glucose 4-epimerase